MATNPIGFILRGIRAGDSRLIWNHESAQAPITFALTSTAFVHEHPIPARFASHHIGGGISPPLSWSPPPRGTSELLLIVEDRDAPLPRPIVHALVAGLEPWLSELPEGAISGSGGRHPAIQGKLLGGRSGYSGPRPIPSHGPHHYIFELYALDKASELAPGFNRRLALAALQGHVLARARLDGTYEVV